MCVNAMEVLVRMQEATIAGGADSFFEYLLKADILFNDPYYGEVFAEVPSHAGMYSATICGSDGWRSLQPARPTLTGVLGDRAELAARPLVSDCRQYD